MKPTNESLMTTLPRDLAAGAVVFVVALPLCLGVALASGAPLLSGVLAGCVGGILVGALSQSHTSVSGASPGSAAIVAALIAGLGFPAFLLAVVIAGLIQCLLGLLRAGFVAAFVPSSVVKGLLTAIGVLLVLKQIPHLLGHDADPQGDMAFQQPDQANTFSELALMLNHVHLGAAAIGVGSVLMLLLMDRWKPLKKSLIPAPLVVVMFGVGFGSLFKRIGGTWAVEPTNFVQVPEAKTIGELLGFLHMPDFSHWTNPAVYTAALTIAAMASLETLLNLEAVDKIDPQQRNSPPSRELLAQGIGNVVVGLMGGIPITSVIVRSSVNINAGAQTKLAAIVHGAFLLVSVVLLPHWLNMIPLSCLAAILLVTGAKLASPKLLRQMWKQGRYQFVPFAATVIAIVFTDLLTGVLIGLGVSSSFILNSNFRRPIRRFVERHLGGDVLHIELANQVSFLNRAALLKVLDAVPRGGQVLLDARHTDYIDPDVLDLIRDFTTKTAPARGLKVSMLGFRSKYFLEDQIQYVDYSTRELQTLLTPQQVLQILKDGHGRFRSGKRLTRDLSRQVSATASSQHPLAAVLSCIDSRAPSELIFDQGLGDILSVRVAGNVVSHEVLGSLEYACSVAGAKLILVMGHTRCGAIAGALEATCSQDSAAKLASCNHLEPIVRFIQQSIESNGKKLQRMSPEERESLANRISYDNVRHVVSVVLQQSTQLAKLRREGLIDIVGAIYDVASGEIDFVRESSHKEIEQSATREYQSSQHWKQNH